MSRSGTKPALCVVSPAQYGGGAEYQVGCLLDVLAARGRFDLNYLAHQIEPTLPQVHYRVTKIGRGTRAPRLGYVSHAMSLFAALRAVQPRVIYQRVACGYTGLCAWYVQRHPARMVWHLANDGDVSRDINPGDRNRVRRWLEWRSIEYGVRHANRIVAQTQTQSELMRTNYGREADVVIPNFHPAATERLDKSGPLTVVWVSNLKPIKRPEVFVQIANALRDRPGVRFVMLGAPAGGGDGPWIAALNAAIVAAPNLQFLGWRPQSEVNALLARAHLFVNTSTREGFPNTFIQAWMRGVPVLSLDIDPDGVLERENIGVHAGSVERLHLAVRSFLDEPGLREACGRRALAYAAREHSMRNAELLADLLERAADEAAAGRPGGVGAST